MTDNVAVLDGYTKEMVAFSTDGMMNLFCLVKPDADLEGRVRVYDTDNQEFIVLNGWNWSFEPAANYV